MPVKEDELNLGDAKLVEDYKGHQIVLFTSFWSINWVQERNKDLVLLEFGGGKEE